MIYSITFPKAKKAYTYKERPLGGGRTRTVNSQYAYIMDVPAVFGKTFKFTPGLNIIVGANGSGKSTILRGCGLSLAAVQCGISTVTENWLRDACGFFGNGDVAFPWKISHNGLSALFVDPRVMTGLAAGGATFDSDFFGDGFSNLLLRGSTGQKTLSRINTTAAVILGKAEAPKDIVWNINRVHVNDVWKRRVDSAEAYLQGNAEPGPVTIIMDEPESYLSIPAQVGFWRRLIGEDPKRFDNLQVIIATHSPFAFGIQHANYIEMEKKYISECMRALNDGRS